MPRLRSGASSRRTISGCTLWLTVLFLCLTVVRPAMPQTHLIDPASDVLRVVSELDYPPLAQVQPNGQADGFTVALFQAVAQAMHLRYTIRVGPWGEIKNAVQQGQADVLINMAYSEERARTHDFTVPHTRVNGAIFVRAGDRRIQALTDLADKSVLVIRGDLPHDWAIQQGWEASLTVVDTAEDGMQRLAAGQHDAMLLAKLVGVSTIRQLKLTNIVPAGPPITAVGQKFAFAVQKGQTSLLATLNEGLALVIADGTFAQLYERWFGPLEPASGVPLKQLLWYASPGLGLVALLLGLLHLRLRRTTSALQAVQQELEQRVATRTAELQVANTALGDEITERRHAEMALEAQRAFLRQVIDMSPTLIFVKDLQERFTLVNQAIADFYGTSIECMLGKTSGDFLQDTEEVQAIQQRNQTVISAATTVVHDAILRTDSHGVQRWFSAVQQPICNAQGQATHVLGVATDITPQKQAEEAMRHLNTELEQRVQERTAALADMNRELEAFTYSVSHDLKAPLRGIDGYSRLLAEAYADRLDQEGQRFLTHIRTGTQRMYELIDDLLAYSRLERRRLRWEKIDLRVLIEGLLAERQQEIDARQVHVTLDLQGALVQADRESAQQMCRNLLDNALKFTSHVDTPRLAIRCQMLPCTWQLHVQDNGIGFDMRYHERIFEMFQRLQREEDYSGTGVGLAIVRKAAERLGGRVWAESTLGQGATFYVEIPYEPTDTRPAYSAR